MKTRTHWLLSLSMILVAGCASAPKAALESQSPEDAIAEVTQYKDEVVHNQVDLLAPKTFNHGMQKLKDARSNHSNQGKFEKTMALASEAKGYFMKAQKEAESRKHVPAAILEARASAAQAGARSSNRLAEQFYRVDIDLRDDTDDFSKPLSPEDYAKYQKSYLNLEVVGVQNRELGAVRDRIERAESDRAGRRVPDSLAKAKIDLSLAENLISQNVKNPENYSEAVAQAEFSSQFLADVMAKALAMGPKTTEKVAIELVNQDRKIAGMKESVTGLEENLQASKSELATMSGAVTAQKEELSRATEKLSLQEAIDEVRRDFSEDEAIVVQQGPDLIIRLKKINFDVGSADLPDESLDLLDKVRSVIKRIGPKMVEVQGHTDSTGSSGLNLALSNERAKSAAKYFSTTDIEIPITASGFGESRPIASNDSKDGRAENRRVDIVVKAR